MAYVKKAERVTAEQQDTPQEQSVAIAYSLVRQEGGYWSYIKWEISSDGKANAVEVSNPDLYPITSDKINRAFVMETQK